MSDYQNNEKNSRKSCLEVKVEGKGNHGVWEGDGIPGAGQNVVGGFV